MLAALADGRSRIHGLAPGQDVRSTLSCLQTLGVAVTFAGARDSRPGTEPGSRPFVEIEGAGLGGLRLPSATLDAGNSGTTMRLLAGILAGHAFRSTLEGDGSLSKRPMERIAAPLRRMGATVDTTGGHAPITITGGPLRPIVHESTVASAQIKSAVLLAGLHAGGRTSVVEPAASRDHTERALRAFGVTVEASPGYAALDGHQRLEGRELTVPGDPSSAAAWAAAAGSVPGSAIAIENVGLNPGRIGFVRALEQAGLDIRIELSHEAAGEPVGTVYVAYGAPSYFEIAPADVPSLIDELPVLAAMSARRGGMRVTGAKELRVKESDRIREIVSGLRALGAGADELEDGFTISPATMRAASVDARDDHRLAMAFAIAALGTGRSHIEGASVVDVSYPGFLDLLAARTS